MREEWSPFRLTAEDRIPALVATLVLVLYAAATLYLGIHHEPWRDEADSWLVVNHASMRAIFTWTRYAGTPALWYILLKPLAWLGLPYFSQTALHLAVAWAAAATLLFLAPFTRLTKVLYLASFYPIYQYSVIARSYALTTLLLFIAAALHQKRRERPILYAVVLVLLFNTNVHGAVIGAALAFLFTVERPHTRRTIAAIAIMIAGALILFLQLRTPPDAAYPGLIRNIDPQAVPFTIGYAFLPALPLSIAVPFGALLLLCIALALRHRRDALLLLVGPSAILLLIYAVVWFGGYRHSGILLITTMAALWIGRPSETTPTVRIAATLLNILLLASAVVSFPLERAEIRFAFSGAKEMGEFIRDHHLDGVDIAGHKPYQCEAVLPYLPGKQIWYAGMQRYGTYLSWDRTLLEGAEVPYEEALARTRVFFVAQHRPWLLLLDTAIPSPSRFGYRLIYRTQRPVFWVQDENFWLYAPL